MPAHCCFSSPSSPAALTHVCQTTRPKETRGRPEAGTKRTRPLLPLSSEPDGTPHPTVMQTLPVAHGCAHATDVPKPRRSSGHRMPVLKYREEEARSLPPASLRFAEGPVLRPAPVLRCGGAGSGGAPSVHLERVQCCAGAGDQLYHSCTHTRTHAQSHVFSLVNSAGTRQEFHLDQLLNILPPALETRLPKNLSSQGPSFPV